jgi:hypothetical protein
MRGHSATQSVLFAITMRLDGEIVTGACLHWISVPGAARMASPLPRSQETWTDLITPGGPRIFGRVPEMGPGYWIWS